MTTARGEKGQGGIVRAHSRGMRGTAWPTPSDVQSAVVKVSAQEVVRSPYLLLSSMG